MRALRASNAGVTSRSRRSRRLRETPESTEFESKFPSTYRVDSLTALRLNEAKLREREAQLEKETAALKRLNEASTRLWQTRELHSGLEEMLVAAMQLVGGDMVMFSCLTAPVEHLGDRGSARIPAGLSRIFKEVSVEDDSTRGRALRSGERIVIEDIESDEEFAPFRAAPRAAGYRAVQSTPLIGYDGKALSILSTHFKSVRRPTARELQLLNLYARQAVAFIERVRSEDRQRLLMDEPS